MFVTICSDLSLLWRKYSPFSALMKEVFRTRKYLIKDKLGRICIAIKLSFVFWLLLWLCHVISHGLVGQARMRWSLLQCHCYCWPPFQKSFLTSVVGGKPCIFQQVLSCIWAYGRGGGIVDKSAWIWVQSQRPMGLRLQGKLGPSGLKLAPLEAMVVSLKKTDWPVNNDCKTFT